MMLVNSIPKGWFCMAMLVYETVSFVIFVTRFFFDWHLSLPKKIGYGISWISVNFFPKKTTTQIPLFHHHFWASIMSHHVSFKNGRFPHQGCDRGGFVRAGIGQFAARRCSDSGVTKSQRSWGEWTSWAMKGLGPWECLGYFWGEDNLPRYIRIIINHHKDPYQTTSIMNVCCICATVDGSEITKQPPNMYETL